MAANPLSELSFYFHNFYAANPNEPTSPDPIQPGLAQSDPPFGNRNKIADWTKAPSSDAAMYDYGNRIGFTFKPEGIAFFFEEWKGYRRGGGYLPITEFVPLNDGTVTFKMQYKEYGKNTTKNLCGRYRSEDPNNPNPNIQLIKYGTTPADTTDILDLLNNQSGTGYFLMVPFFYPLINSATTGTVYDLSASNINFQVTGALFNLSIDNWWQGKETGLSGTSFFNGIDICKPVNWEEKILLDSYCLSRNKLSQWTTSAPSADYASIPGAPDEGYRIGFQNKPEGMVFTIEGWVKEYRFGGYLPVTKFEQLNDGTVTFRMQYRFPQHSLAYPLCGRYKILNPADPNSDIQLIKYGNVPEGTMDIFDAMNETLGDLYTSMVFPKFWMGLKPPLDLHIDNTDFVSPVPLVDLSFAWVEETLAGRLPENCVFDNYSGLFLDYDIVLYDDQPKLTSAFSRSFVEDTAQTPVYRNVLYKIENASDIAKNNSKFIVEAPKEQDVKISQGYKLTLSFNDILGEQDSKIAISAPANWKANYNEASYVWELEATTDINLSAQSKIEFLISNINLPATSDASRSDTRDLTVSRLNTVPPKRPKQFTSRIPIFLYSLEVTPQDSPARPFNLSFVNFKGIDATGSEWNVEQYGVKLLHPDKSRDEIFANSIENLTIKSRLAFQLYNPSKDNPLKKKEGGRFVVSICLGTGPQALSDLQPQSTAVKGAALNRNGSWLKEVELKFANSNKGTLYDRRTDEAEGITSWTFTPRGTNFLEAQEQIQFVFEGLCPDGSLGEASIQIGYYGIEGYKDDNAITYVQKTAPKPKLISPIITPQKEPEPLIVKDPRSDLKLSWLVFGAVSVDLWGKRGSGTFEIATGLPVVLGNFKPGVVEPYTIELRQPEFWEDMELYLKVPSASNAEYKIAKMTYLGPWNAEWKKGSGFTSDWMHYEAKGTYAICKATKVDPLYKADRYNLKLAPEIYDTSGIFRMALRYTDELKWHLLIEIHQTQLPHRVFNTDNSIIWGSPPSFGGGYIQIDEIDITSDGKPLFTTKNVQLEVANGEFSSSNLRGVFQLRDSGIEFLQAKDYGIDPSQDISRLFGFQCVNNSTRYTLCSTLSQVKTKNAKLRPAYNENHNVSETLIINGDTKYKQFSSHLDLSGEKFWQNNYSSKVNKFVLLSGISPEKIILKPDNDSPSPFVSETMFSSWHEMRTTIYHYPYYNGAKYRYGFQNKPGGMSFVIEVEKLNEVDVSFYFHVVKFLLKQDGTVKFTVACFIDGFSDYYPIEATGTYRLKTPQKPNSEVLITDLWELEYDIFEGSPFLPPEPDNYQITNLIAIQPGKFNANSGHSLCLSRCKWREYAYKNTIGEMFWGWNQDPVPLSREGQTRAVNFELFNQDQQDSRCGDSHSTRSNFDGVELEDANFAYADLFEVSLSNSRLIHANFEYAILSKANLAGSQLNYSNFRSTNLNRANLEGASLLGANLTGASLIDANLLNTNLMTAIVRGARFSQNSAFSDEQKQDLIDRGAIFVEESELEMGQFPQALLDARARSAPTPSPDTPQRLDLIEQKLDTLLQHLQLTPSNSQSPTLPADLQSPPASPTPEGNGDTESSAKTSPPDEPRRNLQGVIFRGAELSNKNLSNIDLSKADLSGSDLKETNLSYTLLREANLSGANLTGANLTEADLTGANLTGTNLTGTTVSKACFDKTIGLSDEQRQALAAQSALLSQPEETVASNADFVTDKPRVQTQYL